MSIKRSTDKEIGKTFYLRFQKNDEEIKEVLQFMLKQGFAPTTLIRECLLHNLKDFALEELYKAKDYETAEQLIESLKKDKTH